MDRVCISNGTRFQHGRHNDRVYLMNLGDGDHGAVHRLERLARRRGYGKIVAKVPEGRCEGFLRKGYGIEARVPGMYRGETDCLFLAKYLDGERHRPPGEGERKVLQGALRRWSDAGPVELEEGYETVVCRPEDVGEMAALYALVFDTYPVPIDDHAHLERAMEEAEYRAVLHEGRMVAIAAAEMDREGMNAEVTDLATIPEHRGKGLSSALVRRLEEDMRARGMRTLYSIARAASHGVNAVLARNGYRHSGVLPSNTNIAGGIETMNVWHKGL